MVKENNLPPHQRLAHFLSPPGQYLKSAAGIYQPVAAHPAMIKDINETVEKAPVWQQFFFSPIKLAGYAVFETVLLLLHKHAGLPKITAHCRGNNCARSTAIEPLIMTKSLPLLL